MTVTPIRRAHHPISEAQVLKSRYDEARQIKEAWDYRLKRAQAEHSDAIRHGGDHEATRRNLNAIDIQVADAAGELAVALHAWMASVHYAESTLHTYRRAS